MYEAPFAQMADLLEIAARRLATFDRAELPAVKYLRVGWDESAGAVVVRAHLGVLGGPYATDQEAQIDGIRAWANALGGVLHLGDDRPWSTDDRYRVRTLQAFAPLPGGGHVEIYTLLNTTPAADLATA